MGRPRKTLDQHARDGTTDSSRHASRLREPKFDGQPEKPPRMSKEASQHWDEIVPQLVSHGVAKKSDQSALIAMCEAWSEYRAALRRRPKNTEQRKLRRIEIKSFLDDWRQLASRFGLTPADRAKLEVAPGDDQTNPFEVFLKQRMQQN